MDRDANVQAILAELRPLRISLIQAKAQLDGAAATYKTLLAALPNNDTCPLNLSPDRERHSHRQQVPECVVCGGLDRRRWYELLMGEHCSPNLL